MLLCLFIIKIAHIYSSSRYYNGYFQRGQQYSSDKLLGRPSPNHSVRLLPVAVAAARVTLGSKVIDVRRTLMTVQAINVATMPRAWTALILTHAAVYLDSQVTYK